MVMHGYTVHTNKIKLKCRGGTVTLIRHECTVPPTRVRITVSPDELRVSEGTEAEFVCSVDVDVRTRLVWSRLPQVIITYYNYYDTI